MSASLAGWTPFSAAWRDGTMVVDWCRLGEARFVEPFFYETIVGAMRRPFNLAFTRRTTADALAALAPTTGPTGFVFHMSRCGSTLVAQALAADPANIVVSEAMAIRSVLRAAEHGPASEADIARWLAGLVAALGRPRFGETRLFVKFMAADVLDLPLIARVFPDVPWLFLFRDPLEILASQRARGGADTARGALSAERLEFAAGDLAALDWPRYQLTVLSAFAQAALAALERPDRAARPRGMILDYAALPAALETIIPEHFGFVPDAVARAAMAVVAGRDAKAPDRAFVRDRIAKRAAAAPWTEAAAAIAGPTFAALAAAARVA